MNTATNNVANTNANANQVRPARSKGPLERVEQRGPTVAPYVDVFENANEILLWADVPGATREGIDVHVEKGQLTLAARRPPAAVDGGPRLTPLETEHRAHDYYRVFAVPSGIDATRIEAELTAGVLKVRLPKSEALKPRRIEVKAG